MALSFSVTTANAMLDAIVTKADAGSGPAKIRIYTGTMPANASGVVNNVMLAELTCSKPCGASASKVLTFNTITQDTSADFSGNATFFRLLDSANNTVLQGDASLTGGAGALQMSSLTITQGQPVPMASATLSLA